MARSKNRRKRSKGASSDFSAPDFSNAGSFGSSSKKQKPLETVPEALPKAIENSIDFNEWGSALVACGVIAAGAGLAGSLGRYAGNTPPGAVVYDGLGADGRLLLQGAATVGASALITSVALKDVEAPFLNFKKGSTAKYVNTIAFGAAAYRILTGLQYLSIGDRFSGLFDGNFAMMTMGPQKPYLPMINTPAQKSALQRSFESVSMTAPGTNVQYTSYTPVNQAAFHQAMKS